MKLDLIIATCNREVLLQRALESVLRATCPPDLDLTVTVVDNKSRDRTKQIVEQLQPQFNGRLKYIFEPRQGKSFALNTGIAQTSGTHVGMIDDDEEIATDWLIHCAHAFAPGIDFIGGPYLPNWGAEQPAWLPMTYKGVIGWVEVANEPAVFDRSFSGMLMGGNCVFTRDILAKAGPYSTVLNRTERLLLAGEDEDMYHRLLALGAHGRYLPNLAIHHYIPAERLTKQYFRRWCFWRGVSLGLMDRSQRQHDVAYLAGVPRYVVGRAARSLARSLARTIRLRRDPPDQSFTDVLSLVDLAGFAYGKHFYKSAT